jgi:hypothetical protein
MSVLYSSWAWTGCLGFDSWQIYGFLSSFEYPVPRVQTPFNPVEVKWIKQRTPLHVVPQRSLTPALVHESTVLLKSVNLKPHYSFMVSANTLMYHHNRFHDHCTSGSWNDGNVCMLFLAVWWDWIGQQFSFIPGQNTGFFACQFLSLNETRK